MPVIMMFTRLCDMAFGYFLQSGVFAQLGIETSLLSEGDYLIQHSLRYKKWRLIDRIMNPKAYQN